MNIPCLFLIALVALLSACSNEEMEQVLRLAFLPKN